MECPSALVYAFLLNSSTGIWTLFSSKDIFYSQCSETPPPPLKNYSTFFQILHIIVIASVILRVVPANGLRDQQETQKEPTCGDYISLQIGEFLQYWTWRKIMHWTRIFSLPPHACFCTDNVMECLAHRGHIHFWFEREREEGKYKMSWISSKWVIFECFILNPISDLFFFTHWFLLFH